MNNFEFVNFDDYDDKKTITVSNGRPTYNKKYDTTTTEFYRVLRERKIDVITQEEVPEEKAFKFEYQWDPYTGERTEKDPYGPLYFFPDSLIRYFDVKKMNGLWINEVDEEGGYFSGYYGDVVGNGENINVVGRGLYPELYLFRIPIADCYLAPEHDMSIITMGPKLTMDELITIDNLAEKYYKNDYYREYKKKRPSLAKMKKIYDVAIDVNPKIIEYNNLPNVKMISDVSLNSQKRNKDKMNRGAVDLLRKL